jgi:hypothetical protein
MNRCYAFPGRRFIRCPPRHLAIEDLLTQLLRRYTPVLKHASPNPYCMHLHNRRIDRRYLWSWRRFIRCWRPRLGASLYRFKLSVEYTDGVITQIVGSSSATVFAALPLQFIRRIDKMDRRFIRRCQLHFASCAVYQLHRRYAPMVPSVYPTVSFSFLFFASSTWIFVSTSHP